MEHMQEQERLHPAHLSDLSDLDRNCLSNRSTLKSAVDVVGRIFFGGDHNGLEARCGKLICGVAIQNNVCRWIELDSEWQRIRFRNWPLLSQSKIDGE
jgi:hypothetical protein